MLILYILLLILILILIFTFIQYKSDQLKVRKRFESEDEDSDESATEDEGEGRGFSGAKDLVFNKIIPSCCAMVIDEVQKGMRNDENKRHKFMRGLRVYKIGLSATPVVNNQGELPALVQVLNGCSDLGGWTSGCS
jgi:hypothetical protein